MFGKQKQATGKKKPQWIFRIAVLVAILVGAGMAVSLFIDWRSYKPLIEEKASAALGRQVRINGDISGMLLPITVVTVKDVHVASIEGAKYPDFVSIGEAEVKLNPFSLLSGMVDVQSVKLKEPVINAEALANGKNSWDVFPPKDTAAQKAEAQSQESAAASLSVNTVEIEKGTIRYINHAEKSEKEIADLNVTASPNFAQKMVKADGSLKFEGQKIEFNGEAKPDGKDKWAANFSVESDMIKASFNGAIVTADPAGAEGDYSFALNKAVSGIDSAAMKGRLVYADKQLTLNETPFEVNKINGTLALKAKFEETPNIDARLNFKTIDVAEFQKMAPAESAAPKGGKAETAKPASLPFTGTVLVTADKVVYNPYTLSNMKLDVATSSPTVLQVKEFSAALPASSAVKFTGVANIRDKGVSGPLRFETKNLPELAKTFGQQVAWLETQSKELTLTGNLTANGNAVKFDSMKVDHGATQASANVTYTLAGKKIAVSNFEMSNPSLKKLSGQDIAADGKFLAKGDITTSLEGDLFKNLNGSNYFEIKDGYAQGIDLKAISARLKELNTLADFVALSEQAKNRTGKTNIQSLTSNWKLDNGVAKSNDIKLVADSATARGEGIVNLPDKKLDVTTMMKMTEHPKVPEFGVRVTGTFEAPQYDIKTAALESYYAQKAINKVIEKNVDTQKLQQKLDGKGGKLLNKILGQ